MEICLLVLEMVMVLMTITLGILATVSCKIRMASVTVDSVSRDNALTDHTDNFPEINCSFNFEEDQAELISNTDLEHFMNEDDMFSFSNDWSPSSLFDERALDADSSSRCVYSCNRRSSSDTLGFVSDATSPNSSKDLLSSDTADNGETSLSKFESDVQLSDTESSCDTLTEVLDDEKCPSKGTSGRISCGSPPSDDVSMINFNEMNIEEAGFESLRSVFSYTSLLLGSNLVSLITRQHLRDTISARSRTFPGEGSSANSLKAQKPNEVDKVRREKKKKLNRDWARRDRTKRQGREKELKLTISCLDQENKKLETELRLLREDLVVLQNIWLTHRVFYHD